MAQLKKYDDNSVEFIVTPEELNDLKTILAYTGENFDKTDLTYDGCDSIEIKSLSEKFRKINEVHFVLSREDALTLNRSVYACTEMDTSGLTTDRMKKIFNDFYQFDFRKEFYGIQISEGFEKDREAFLAELTGE
ncbi:hypothetical protein [Marinomonas aquiplantarum]|uniref:Uncharacterized protein n=1 Tax=Marinomonas aquiplantarum TaxID=491951 RepID=A0A366D1Z2_9GAMM|nr:hypothetical protein [Marinomonas aquiplantarum]RBO83454.1 hypothetical protein DFP76_104273 [Marinomonas aquiplantarum]